MASREYLGVVSALSTVQDGIRKSSGNIATASVIAKKASSTVFSSQITGDSSSTKSGSVVSAKVRQNIAAQGDFQADSINTHIAVNGQGLIPVKSASGNSIYFTRDGSFQLKANGNLVNDQGFTLQGWRLDGGGRIPGAPGNTTNTTSSSQFNSLEAVDLNNLSGTAKGTTQVDLELRLDASFSPLKGAGEVLSISNGAIFGPNLNITRDDVIIPGTSSIGSVALGDRFSIAVGTQTAVNFVYDGVTSTRKLNGLYSSTNVSDIFKSSPTSYIAGTQVKEGDGIQITVGTSTPKVVTFAGGGNPNAALGQFTSIQSLADALNNINGVAARIKDGRLYVAPKDGVSALTFNNTGNTQFIEDLVISNVPAAGVGVSRFTTLSSLQSQIQSVVGLTVKPQGTSSIGVFASSASDIVSLDGLAARVNTIKGATFVKGTGVSASTSLNINTITINHNAHGLKAGDYINISGGNFTLEAGKFQAGDYIVDQGIYYVTSVADDSFSIALKDSATVASGTYTSALKNASTSTATWQKVPGLAGTSASETNVNVALTTAAGVGSVRIIATHALAVNDVIYLSGLGNTAAAGGTTGAYVPDGYYRVSAVTGTSDFTIQVATAVATHAAQATGQTINFNKIGKSATLPRTIESTSIFLTTANSQTVKMFMPNHGLAANDLFRIKTDNGATSITFDNMTINTAASTVGNNQYRVVAADTDWITFLVPYASGTPPVGGYQESSTAGFGNVSLDLFCNFFEDLGIDPENLNLKPTYNDSSTSNGDQGNNLASGLIDEGVWTQTFAVYDSLGKQNNFKIAFAKFDNNLWQAEIFCAPNSDGTLNIITDNPYGRFKDGYGVGNISFNGDGSIKAIDAALRNAIPIQWANGALDSSIKFDFGPVISTLSSSSVLSGVRQVVGAGFESMSIQQNGYSASDLQDIQIDSTGKVNAIFNGSVVSIFQIPLVKFADYNGLAEHSGSVYTTTNNSGNPQLGQATLNGLGEFISSSLEMSNINQISEMTDMMGLMQSYKYAAKALQQIEETERFFIQNI